MDIVSLRRQLAPLLAGRTDSGPIDIAINRQIQG